MKRPLQLTAITVAALALSACPFLRNPDDLLDGITARVVVVDVDEGRSVALQVGDELRQSRVTTDEGAEVELALVLPPGDYQGSVTIIKENEDDEGEDERELERCGAFTFTIVAGVVETVVLDADLLPDCDGEEGEEGEGEEGEGEEGEGEGEGEEGEGEAGEGEGEGEGEEPCLDECVNIPPGGSAVCGGTETCDFFCAEGCSVDAGGEGMDLELVCDGGSCDVSIESSVDSDAVVRCTGAGCDVTVTEAGQTDVLVLCEEGACDLACSALDDGACTLRCDAGTTCTMACNQVATCHLECAAGASCTVSECVDSGLCGPFAF